MIWRREIDEENKKKFDGSSVSICSYAFCNTCVCSEGKEESTSKANTESISKEASAKDDGERTIIDHAGNEVTLPEEINRIVVTDTLPAAICIVTIFR